MRAVATSVPSTWQIFMRRTRPHCRPTNDGLHVQGVGLASRVPRLDRGPQPARPPARAIGSARNPGVVAAVHEHRYGEPARLVQGADDAHSYVEVGRALLDAGHLGLKRQVTHLNVVDSVADDQEPFRVPAIRITSAVPRPHGIDLTHVVLEQVAAEPAHALGSRVVAGDARARRDRVADRRFRAFAREAARAFVEHRIVDLSGHVEPSRGVRHVHADRIGVGVDAHEQRRRRAAAAMRVLYRLRELREPFEQRRGGAPLVACVGRATPVGRVGAAEMIDADLEESRGLAGGVRPSFAPAA